MKKIILLLTISVPILLNAQIVSDRTSDMVVDISTEDKKISFPEIKWIYPRLEYTQTRENSVTIEATISSQVPIKNFRIAIKKDKESESRGTRSVKIEDSVFTVEVSKKLFLMDGENVIEITAENTDGGIVKDYRSVLIGMDAITDAVAIDRQDFALLVATDKYDQFNDLVNPVFDAESIAKELKDRYNFKVDILKNADQDQIMVKLREYAQKDYRPQDQLMIFFAGHGLYDEVYGEGYVVAKNSLAHDEGKNTYISYNRIRNNINNIPCNHIFLAMDVCFGGTFDQKLASSRSVYEKTDDRAYLARKLSKKTRKYLTSGSKEYVSDGVVGQHSPFARNLIEALKSNGNDDHILILDEIKLFMERLQTNPRYGSFGADEQGSDFVFVAR